MAEANPSIGELSAKWDRIAAEARKIDWGDLEIGELSGRCGLPWFESRSRERVIDYLGCDASRLVLQRGFGRGKIARLCDLLAAALETGGAGGNRGIDPGQAAAPGPVAALRQDPREALHAWSVPESFPCRLAAFSNRLHNFLESRRVNSIGELVDTWMELGYSGLIQQKNLGKKTVAEVRELISALLAGDRQAAGRFIPLGAEAPGLSLATAIAMISDGFSPREADLMYQRLVVGKTLEDTAEGTDLTRERIRQYEAKLLAGLRDRLEYFAESCSELVDSWFREEGSWFDPVRPARHPEIIKSALETLFGELPQAVARRLNEESERETLFEDLRTHPELWFGGVPVKEFLEDRVPGDRQAAACAFLGTTGEFRIDHGSGRFHPRNTGLFRTTMAILDHEDNPIPLTWLIILLRRTGFHPAVSREVLVRGKWRWEKRPGFPARMILWDE